MRVFEAIRNNPIAVLCILLAGLGGWLAARFPPQPPAPLADPRPNLDDFPPLFVERTQTERWITSTEALPKLKPGMTRVEVEGILGPPTADALHPVSANEGRLTYRTAYALAEPDEPMTVRPIKAARRLPPKPRELTPHAVVALEFDASRPGHPLVEVHFLDPLF